MRCHLSCCLVSYTGGEAPPRLCRKAFANSGYRSCANRRVLRERWGLYSWHGGAVDQLVQCQPSDRVCWEGVVFALRSSTTEQRLPCFPWLCSCGSASAGKAFHRCLVLLLQASATVAIPKEHHRFVIGKKGEKLQDLKLKTATKMQVPRPDDPSNQIKISGTKEGIEKARHEILLISAEQVPQYCDLSHGIGCSAILLPRGVVGVCSHRGYSQWLTLA